MFLLTERSAFGYKSRGFSVEVQIFLQKREHLYLFILIVGYTSLKKARKGFIIMTLKLLTGEAHEVSNEKYQYQFTLGGNDIVLSSKIEHYVSENDQLTVVSVQNRT